LGYNITVSKELFFVRKESKSLTNHRDDMKSLFPIAAAASIASLAMGVEAYDSRRQLEEVATSRHSFSASSLEIDFHGEYFCKPDGDGYFGSTMGNSVPVTYGLAIEYSPDADLFSIFSQISHLVEKTLLTYFFPEECKYSTNRIRKARILSDVPLTGFRFTRELEKMPEACEAKSTNGVCAIYKGVVLVYGNAVSETTMKTIYDKVENKFDEDGSKTIAAGLLNIYSVNVLETAQSGDVVGVPTTKISTTNNTGTSTGNGGIQSAAIVGIVLSVVALAIGITGLVYVERKRRLARASAFSKVNRTLSRNSIDAASDVF